MTITSGNYKIKIEDRSERGKTWVVRLFKNRFLINKRISSDWFLDELQAKKFAEQLAEQLKAGNGEETAETRKPGWTLLRPSH